MDKTVLYLNEILPSFNKYFSASEGIKMIGLNKKANARFLIIEKKSFIKDFEEFIEIITYLSLNSMFYELLFTDR